ncbi:unnamed protein product [Prunus armeniaca]
MVTNFPTGDDRQPPQKSTESSLLREKTMFFYWNHLRSIYGEMDKIFRHNDILIPPRTGASTSCFLGGSSQPCL